MMREAASARTRASASSWAAASASCTRLVLVGGYAMAPTLLPPSLRTAASNAPRMLSPKPLSGWITAKRLAPALIARLTSRAASSLASPSSRKTVLGVAGEVCVGVEQQQRHSHLLGAGSDGARGAGAHRTDHGDHAVHGDQILEG